MKSQKGFTLIELLVVIAIIGILSGIVLTSLNTARNKSKDAAIKSELSSLRSQIELDADGGAYVCPADSGASSQSQAIAAKIAVYNGGNNVLCTTDTGSFAVSAQLVSGVEWCVDNTGGSGEGTSSGGSCSN